MKKIFAFILFSIPIICNAQKAHHSVKPHSIKQHDSTYYTVDADTTYGTIEYNVGSGKVSGKGMIRHWQITHWTVSVPVKKNNISVGTFASGWSDDLNTHNDAYILYNGSWKGLDYNTKFIFKPNP